MCLKSSEKSYIYKHGGTLSSFVAILSCGEDISLVSAGSQRHVSERGVPLLAGSPLSPPHSHRKYLCESRGACADPHLLAQEPHQHLSPLVHTLHTCTVGHDETWQARVPLDNREAELQRGESSWAWFIKLAGDHLLFLRKTWAENLVQVVLLKTLFWHRTDLVLKESLNLT